MLWILDWMVYHHHFEVEHEYVHDGSIPLNETKMNEMSWIAKNWMKMFKLIVHMTLPCFFHVDTIYFQCQYEDSIRKAHLWFLEMLDFPRIDLYGLFGLLDVIFYYWCKLDKCKPIYKVNKPILIIEFSCQTSLPLYHDDDLQHYSDKIYLSRSLWFLLVLKSIWVEVDAAIFSLFWSWYLKKSNENMFREYKI